jgi:glutamyl-tRNA synthetase
VRERGFDWDPDLARRAAPHVQEKIEKLGDFPQFAGFLFREVSLDGTELDGRVLEEAERTLAGVEPFTAAEIEAALRALAERLELKPREAFQPIRLAVTGSKVSPGLFESLELLGKDRSLARLSAARP